LKLVLAGAGRADAGHRTDELSKPAPTLVRVDAWLIEHHHSPVGVSLLAKAVCQATSVLNLMTPSRAGSLPHCFVLMLGAVSTAILCGSGLARESGVSGDINVESDDAFASKPAPTLFCVVAWRCENHHSLVGVSLLAKAVCQATSMVNLMTPSRASSLPHCFVLMPGAVSTAILCGSELARESGVSGDINGESDDAFASRLAPTLFCVVF
jgi:hypothetical protein